MMLIFLIGTKKMKNRHCNFKIILVYLILIGLLVCSKAEADGGFISGKFEDIHAPEQKAAIVWDGKYEAMVLSTKVSANELDDFGWIIPIHSRIKPEVELANAEIFDILKDYFKTIPRNYDSMYLGINGSEQGVVILETKNIGIFKITIVKATDARKFANWLQTNGFQVNPTVQNALDNYIRKDFFFVLAKIDLTNEYKEDIDFIENQDLLKDIKSLDGKAIKALTFLRWPQSNESLAALISKDIIEGRSYEASILSTNLLNLKYNLVSRKDYDTFGATGLYSSDEAKEGLIKKIEESIYNNKNIQHFVQIENAYKDLEAGVANPLKITFRPPQPFFPLRISRINEGDVSVVVYIFANEPLKDKNGILTTKAWKSVSRKFKQEVSDYLDVRNRRYLTKLTFFNNSAEFVNDTYFEPITGKEKKKLFEDRQIIEATFRNALSWMSDANAVAKIFDEYPNAHEFMDDNYLLNIIYSYRYSLWIREEEDEYINETKKILKLFLQHGFSINAHEDERAMYRRAGNRKGRTAMHILADIDTYQWKPTSEISAFLIENGADINALDYDGKTPLDYIFDVAQKHSYDSLSQMAAFLVRNGGTLRKWKGENLGYIKGRFSQIVLPAAKEVGNKKIIALLENQ